MNAVSTSPSSPLGVLATFVSITIATIGIVNSFVLSRFNERSFERRARLHRQLEELQTRTLRLPEELFEQSAETLRNEIQKIRILTTKSVDLFLGIPPLAFFLPSFFVFYYIDYGSMIFTGMQADISTLGSFAHFFFIVGVALLIPYVISITSLLWAFLRFYSLPSPRKCSGTLKWAEPKCEEKTITRSFSKDDVLNVKILFKGQVTNGFIDTLLIYTDGARNFQIWVPDKLTYLSPRSYDLYGTLIIDSDLDTGTLQGRLTYAFDLEFRVGESSHHPPVHDLLWRGMHGDVYEDYYVPQEMRVKELRIRMYVDPLHSPRLERRSLDKLVIRNSEVP
jgi:hypothetical protein